MIRFITFEGGDGTGKTTQLKALESHLQSKGCSCVSTREPGGTSLGKLIRQVLLEVGKQAIASPTELFLYLADRAQHVQEVILPAIDGGKIVLCDRYTDSTLAYQGYGRGIDFDLLRQLNQFANRGVKPDLTLLLDCPVELGLSRTAQRQSNAGSARGREDRFEREKVEFHEKVRAGFLAMARAEPERFRVIDAARPMEQVSREIQIIVDREMG
ncbi:MAG: dTMP kinase [Deltaproteobacteria bacterium]|nr:dTMP kinase [Deltaproteobacteria bacterium]